MPAPSRPHTSVHPPAGKVMLTFSRRNAAPGSVSSRGQSTVALRSASVGGSGVGASGAGAGLCSVASTSPLCR